MAFDNFGITTNGYTMIAKATTGVLMTFQDGRASSNTISQADIASATTSDFSTLTNGVLKALSVTGSAVQAIIEFSNAGLQSAVTLKSFCIRAHSSDSSSTNYVFAVCSINTGGITLQPQSVTGVEVRFQVPFDLTFTGASTYIEGIPVGNNASVDMLNRFVSLHSLANPATGDAQTILGEKTFTDAVAFGDTSIFHDEATFKSGIALEGNDGGLLGYTLLGYYQNGLGVRNITPTSNNIYRLGNPDNKFLEAYIGSISFAIYSGHYVAIYEEDGALMFQPSSEGAYFTENTYFQKNINVTGTATLKSAVLPTYGSNDLPVGAMTVLARLPSGLNVGDTLQGDSSYKYATLNGLQEADARSSTAAHTYKVLSATNSSCDWALVIRTA